MKRVIHRADSSLAARASFRNAEAERHATYAVYAACILTGMPAGAVVNEIDELPGSELVAPERFLHYPRATAGPTGSSTPSTPARGDPVDRREDRGRSLVRDLCPPGGPVVRRTSGPAQARRGVH
jgi:hypothetical protein